VVNAPFTIACNISAEHEPGAQVNKFAVHEVFAELCSCPHDYPCSQAADPMPCERDSRVGETTCHHWDGSRNILAI
jgi:hypothetical protein